MLKEHNLILMNALFMVLALAVASPRGELTHFQSNDRGVRIGDSTVARVVIDDRRAIQRVYVRVEIDHPSSNDLEIELVAPGGLPVVLRRPVSEPARDLRVTFGVDAEPVQSFDVLRQRTAAGIWELRVWDRGGSQAGTLRSWSLVLQLDGAMQQRPTDRTKQIVPVVVRQAGAYGAFFMSDVRLSNPSGRATTATLVFTRTGEDGLRNFSAIRVFIAAGHTVVFDDVLAGAFYTSGSGTLEILGDVIAVSRAYTRLPGGGTGGDRVQTDRYRASEPTKIVAPMPTEETGRWRTNLSVTNESETPADVFVRTDGLTRILKIPPFSNAMASTSLELHEITSAVKFSAYIAQIDNISGDAMFIPANSVVPYSVVGAQPYARGPGAYGSYWSTDFWLGVRGRPWYGLMLVVRGKNHFELVYPFPMPADGQTMVFPDFVGRQINGGDGIGTVSYVRPPQVFTGARATNGSTSQFIPLMPRWIPPAKLHLFVENSDLYRTNIGFYASAPINAQVVVYDSAGREVERRMVTGGHGLTQFPVIAPVVGGRAEVLVLSEVTGAYSSIIDRVSGDAMCSPGQLQ